LESATAPLISVVRKSGRMAKASSSSCRSSMAGEGGHDHRAT
jgi:hypothetical protein